MFTKNRLIVVVIVGVLISTLACNLNDPIVLPTPVPQATATAMATMAPTATEVPATATAQPTTEPTKKPTARPTATAQPPTEHVSGTSWQVTYFDGATDQMHGWGDNLKPLVTDWDKFPNVDFPKYGFSASDGVEYGMDESAFCQQDQRCDVNTPALHYRLITGDYNIPGVGECKEHDGIGCAIILTNVGNVTAMWRDSQVDYGFTVEGRFWNGNAMSKTIWALGSNTIFNMMTHTRVNPGANCSIPSGCSGVELTWVVTSGNQVLMKSVTTVTR